MIKAVAINIKCHDNYWFVPTNTQGGRGKSLVTRTTIYLPSAHYLTFSHADSKMRK